MRLENDALKKDITRETYEEFAQRVKDTVYNIPKELLNKTVESLPCRIEQIIKAKGRRLMY